MSTARTGTLTGYNRRKTATSASVKPVRRLLIVTPPCVAVAFSSPFVVDRCDSTDATGMDESRSRSAASY